MEDYSPISLRKTCQPSAITDGKMVILTSGISKPYMCLMPDVRMSSKPL